MIELTVFDYLKSQFTTSSETIPVYMETPEEMPGTFILVEKTGSGTDDKINSATIAVQSYAPTLYEVALLNERVKGFMDSLPETQNVFRCKLNSDYNFTDTQTKRYRYQAVYDLTY